MSSQILAIDNVEYAWKGRTKLVMMSIDEGV